MKKSIYTVAFLVTGLLVTSCGDRTSELESLQEEKKEVKEEILTLNTTLKELNLQIKELDTVEVDRRKPVGVGTLKKGEFVSYIEVNGVVESKESVTVMPELSGVIRSILVREGSTVRKGQVLARLDTDIINNQIQELEKSLELANELYEKQKRLHEQNVGTEIQYLEAKNRKESLEQSIKTAKSQRSKAVIKSPINGKVDKVYPNRGEMASPGSAFARIVNTSDVYVSADVSEAYFYKIKSGDEARLRMLATDNQLIESTLTYKGNYINPGNRTFKVHAELNNQFVYPPNMIIAVQVVNEKLDSVFTVPRLYVQNDSKGSFLYHIVTKDGKAVAQKLRVTIKESYNGEVVIEGANLTEKTQIVTNNFKGIDAGSEVKIVKK
ncbi:efflux RND transporter periplasmic adaptor subunit [Cyclobacteriaceae bacterium]|nr:efflux RND transporter periplasmic adaptor subunit [Cyclobacteriaceae bacterium]